MPHALGASAAHSVQSITLSARLLLYFGIDLIQLQITSLVSCGFLASERTRRWPRIEIMDVFVTKIQLCERWTSPDVGWMQPSTLLEPRLEKKNSNHALLGL